MKKINRKGFTLVELLAVIVIIAILATIAVTNVIPMMGKAKLGSTGSSLSGIIISGFQTCASSQVSDNDITTNCTVNNVATSYVKNFSASEVTGVLTVTSNTITITYSKNGYKIVISNCAYDKAANALTKIKESYSSGKNTYTLSSTCETWTVS